MFDQFNGDPLPYGLSQIKRSNIARLSGFLYDQKLVSRELGVDELFLPRCRSFSE